MRRSHLCRARGSGSGLGRSVSGSRFASVRFCVGVSPPAADMKLPAAALVLVVSVAVSVDASIFFQEQFLDGGESRLVPPP